MRERWSYRVTIELLPHRCCRLLNRAGFTLLELMLAVAILAVVSTITYMTFATVTRAWRRGMELSDGIHHGDYVLDQLVMALRSAYYPVASSKGYGFILEDTGDGESARDRISWVKLGSSLVGRSCPFVDSPHRVEFWLEDVDEEGQVAVRAWRMFGQSDDFDKEELEPSFISRRVTGFDCRCALGLFDDEIDWEDEWEDENTNKLPRFVEVTLYLAPPSEEGSTLELRRIVELPTSHLSLGKRAGVPSSSKKSVQGNKPPNINVPL